jgi:serine/threonine protein kinase
MVCLPSVAFAGLPIPTLIQKFRELIIKNSRYTRPNTKTILSAAKSYLMEMVVAVELNAGDDCVELYEKVKDLPKSHTRGIIQDKAHVVLNGPASKDFPNILLGIDLMEKRRIMVKLLKVQEDTLSRTEQEKENAIKSEVEVCKYFRSLNVPGLVKCDVVEVKVDDAQGLSVSIGVWQAIKMHDYGSSLARLPQFPEDFLQDGFHRILSALQFMHSHNYVHMDVKSDNIFVTSELVWDLGDFGSTRKIDQPIFSWTHHFTPYSMPSTCKPIKEMDLVQLCVMIAIELGKQTWQEELCGPELLEAGVQRFVQQDLVLKRLSSVKDSSFRGQLVQLFEASMLAVSKHINPCINP